MGHSVFGWSYPPGCSGPDDNMPVDSALVEEVAGLLEDAGLPEDKIDTVLGIVRAWEDDKAAKADRENDWPEPPTEAQPAPEEQKGEQSE